jgi:hypothetical protein
VHTFTGGLDNWCPDVYKFTITIRGRPTEFLPSSAQYEELGIGLNTPVSEVNCIDHLLPVLRLIAYTLSPDDIFLPDYGIVRYLGRNDLPDRFIELDEWCHSGASGIGKPSESRSIVTLAEALTAGRKDLYECPTHLLNTHWSHWELLPPGRAKSSNSKQRRPA